VRYKVKKLPRRSRRIQGVRAVKIIRSGLLIVLMLSVVACTPQNVKPWQRGDLAKSEMAWESDSLQAAQRQHMFTSKEAAFGNGTLGGGGCGCN
jgi:hypothetical protein